VKTDIEPSAKIVENIMNPTGFFKKMSLQGSWGPGSKHEITLVNLVPMSLTGTFFNAL
jgi:hypothetical protein